MEVILVIEVTAAALAAHPFLHGMSDDHLAVLADAPQTSPSRLSTGSSRTATAPPGSG